MNLVKLNKARQLSKEMKNSGHYCQMWSFQPEKRSFFGHADTYLGKCGDADYVEINIQTFERLLNT